MTLKDTPYLKQPLWLFDYAMLSFQVGQFDAGSEAFRDLRHGQRYLDVPLARSPFLSISPNVTEPRQVAMRVVALEEQSMKGWGRIDQQQLRLRDPVRFHIGYFRKWKGPIRVGDTVTCYIRLNAAGPFAQPSTGEER